MGIMTYNMRGIGCVAQLVRALRSHRRGRWFESNHIHHFMVDCFMYNCKELTDINIQKMLGASSKYEVLTYDLRTQRASSGIYNGQSLILDYSLPEWAELSEYNFSRLNMGTGLQPVVLAVKTVDCPKITIRGDYASAPYCRYGYGALGNIIFFDRRRKQYVSTPNKWVYLGSCSSWQKNSAIALNNLFMMLCRDKSSVLKKLAKRHR